MDTRKNVRSWFVLKNYDAVRDFSLNDWHDAISNRMTWSYLISERRGNDEEMFLEGLAYWEKIREYGLETNVPLQQDPATDSNSPLEIIKAFRRELPTRLISKGSIRDISVGDVVGDVLDRDNLEEVIKDKAQLDKLNTLWFEACRAGDVSLLKKRETLHKKYAIPLSDDEGYEGDYGFAEVNFTASDEQIMQDFQRWLTSHRSAEKTIRRKGKISQKHLNDWTAAKVLPYFDLLMICALDGRPLTNHVLGDLLFPDDVEVDVAERVRKVTKRKVAEVMSFEMTALLEMQCRA